MTGLEDGPLVRSSLIDVETSRRNEVKECSPADDAPSPSSLSMSSGDTPAVSPHIVPRDPVAGSTGASSLRQPGTPDELRPVTKLLKGLRHQANSTAEQSENFRQMIANMVVRKLEGLSREPPQERQVPITSVPVTRQRMPSVIGNSQAVMEAFGNSPNSKMRNLFEDWASGEDRMNVSASPNAAFPARNKVDEEALNAYINQADEIRSALHGRPKQIRSIRIDEDPMEGYVEGDMGSSGSASSRAAPAHKRPTVAFAAGDEIAQAAAPDEAAERLQDGPKSPMSEVPNSPGHEAALRAIAIGDEAALEAEILRLQNECVNYQAKCKNMSKAIVGLEDEIQVRRQVGSTPRTAMSGHEPPRSALLSPGNTPGRETGSTPGSTPGRVVSGRQPPHSAMDDPDALVDAFKQVLLPHAKELLDPSRGPLTPQEEAVLKLLSQGRQ